MDTLKPLTAATAVPIETEHARAVVLQLNDMIDEAIGIRDGLVKLYSLGREFLAAPFRELPPGLPPLADLDPDPAPTMPAPKPARAPKPNGKPRYKSRPSAGGSDEAVLSKLPAVFTADALVKATGLTEKGALSRIYRMRGKGLVENVGSGLWKQTGKPNTPSPQATLDAIKAGIPSTAGTVAD